MFKDVEFWTAVAIFFVYLILDFGGSWFIIELGKLHRWSTTILTFCLYMGSGIGIFTYTHNFGYLLFAALGASLGNFILILVEERKQTPDKGKIPCPQK